MIRPGYNCPRCGVEIQTNFGGETPSRLCFMCIMVANGIDPGGVRAGCDERPGLRQPADNAKIDVRWDCHVDHVEQDAQLAKQRHDDAGACAYCATLAPKMLTPEQLMYWRMELLGMGRISA